MKKIIYNQLLKDITKFFLLSSLSLSLIIWVIQAVNFLDYISEDGHGILTYFNITLLNFPKIFSRILPFCIFISIFYTLNRYENKNELLIFWNIGINKIKFVNVLIIFSFIFLLLQIFLNTLIVPKTLNSAREYIRNSNVDFFPNLIKEKKFIDVVENLTIFVESKDKEGNLKNIYLKDLVKKNQSQIIYAESGKILSENGKNFLVLNNGSFIDINNKNLTRFAFKRTDINLDKYSSKTTKTPKFQELSTINLISCLYKLNYNIILSKIPTYFQCESKAENDIDEELFKRIIKPFFIPSIVLIACLIILSNKDSYKYNRLQNILFIVGFFVIVISEITARYIGNSKIEFFIFLPLITFLISYLFFIFKLRVSR